MTNASPSGPSLDSSQVMELAVRHSHGRVKYSRSGIYGTDVTVHVLSELERFGSRCGRHGRERRVKVLWL
jgi:hypothetical protein